MSEKHENIILRLRNYPEYFKVVLIIFYTVGVTAIYIPFTSAFFISLTPLALLLSFGVLMLFHRDFRLKTMLIFAFIFLAGFLVEMIGTNSGLIFGGYTYGPTLGLKIGETPVLMGLNWIMMIYLTATPVRKLKTHPLIKVFLSSSLMVAYDVVLEQVAPAIKMWSWSGDIIPLQNYVAWFVLSVIFHTLFISAKVKVKNELALVLLLTQFFFFVFLLPFSQ